MSGFTHFDSEGNAVMVDVSEKGVTERTATMRRQHHHAARNHETDP